MRLLHLLTYGFASLLWTAADTFLIPNVNASFSNSPEPFRIHVDRNFIEDTRQRVAHTRVPLFMNVTSDGPNAENFTRVRDFWVNEYSWNATEASINDK